MTRRILITGASGYVAGWLISRLEQFPHLELVLGSRSSNSAIRQHRQVHFDLAETTTFAAALSDIDAVVHLAGVNQADCVASPNECRRINTRGTLELQRQASHRGITHFIQVSTIQVFGSPLPLRISSATAAKPSNVYSESYADIEAEASIFPAMRLDIVRLANGFGYPLNSGACWHLALNDFCRQAAKVGEIRLASSGLQQRNFVPIRASVNFLAHLLVSSTSSAPQSRQWTLGSPQSQSVLSAAHSVARRALLQFGREVVVVARDEQSAIAEEPSTLDLAPIDALGFDTESLGDAAHQQMIDETLDHCGTL